MTSMFMDVKYSFSTDASIGRLAVKDPGTEKLERPVLRNVVPASSKCLVKACVG